jgi:hypothetical protein
VIAGIRNVVPACSIAHEKSQKTEFRYERVHWYATRFRDNARVWSGALVDGIVEVTGSIPVGSTN